MFLHAVISILLLVIILMQSGRGGGLTEGFASAESMFGAQTNEFMIKATTVFATIFFVSCLGLAILSSQKGKSLMSSKVASEVEQVSVAETVEEVADEQLEFQVGTEETRTPKISESLADSLPDDLPASETPASK